MNKNNIIFNRNEVYEANYKEQVINEYRDNPFIESLPGIYSFEEVVDKLSYYPYIDKKEKELEVHYKVHAVQRLFDYFQPLEQHVDLESRISRIIRTGYIARNPFKRGHVESLHQGYKRVLNENIDMNINISNTNTASGFTFIGISGIGKTTAINKILSLYPQTIIHSEYKGIKYSTYQIVWLKLDCPHDGSLKGLCIDFFRKIDSLIGTNYFKKYGTGRQAVNVLLPIMGQVAKSLNIGVIIIDEIQHANMAKSGGADKLLNFFVTLINTIGVPTILIGTPRALNILQNHFRQARRGSGQQGDMIWDRMKNDESWDLLLRGMWEYQWTNKSAPFTEEYRDLMYDKTQGITDLALKIYIMSQVRAIILGKQSISKEIIEKVSKENFKLVEPMLEAIRSGNIKKLAQYEDIYTVVDLDNFIQKEKSRIDLNKKIEKMKIQKQKEKTIDDTALIERAVLKLMDLDVKGNKAKRIVEKVIKDEINLRDVNEIVKKTYKIYIQQEEERMNKKKKKNRYLDNDDLRLIIASGKENNISAYEILKAHGYIKDSENDIFELEA